MRISKYAFGMVCVHWIWVVTADAQTTDSSDSMANRYALCKVDGGTPVGPAQISLKDGRLGLARRVCARNEIGVDLEGLAVIEPNNFYGRVRASSHFFGSLAIKSGTELFLSLETLRYETVISSFSAEVVGFGHTTLGVTQRIVGERDWNLSFNVRSVLPTATGLYNNIRPFGVDVAILAAYRPFRVWRFHAQLGSLGTFAVGKGDNQLRLGATSRLGSQWQFTRFMAVMLEVHTAFGYHAALDALAILPTLRWTTHRLGIELAGLIPMAGRERAQVAAALRFTWRLQD